MYNKLSVSESIKLWDIKDTVKEIDSVITIFSTLLNVNTFYQNICTKIIYMCAITKACKHRYSKEGI